MVSTSVAEVPEILKKFITFTKISPVFVGEFSFPTSSKPSLKKTQCLQSTDRFGAKVSHDTGFSLKHSWYLHINHVKTAVLQIVSALNGKYEPEAGISYNILKQRAEIYSFRVNQVSTCMRFSYMYHVQKNVLFANEQLINKEMHMRIWHAYSLNLYQLNFIMQFSIIPSAANL